MSKLTVRMHLKQIDLKFEKVQRCITKLAEEECYRLSKMKKYKDCDIAFHSRNGSWFFLKVDKQFNYNPNLLTKYSKFFSELEDDYSWKLAFPQTRIVYKNGKQAARYTSKDKDW